ncbi:MAG TPA: bifunctional phosphoribosylaminoimidazolecarboxamide formyltransferase/IMP cyclohydrolase [Candidatus Brocadiia bacterium]
MAKIKTALISVSDKTNIVEFAKGLLDLGVDIISSGGTAKLLKENGIKATEVSEYTGFPEIMDGRVKTLHPKVHGGLLAVRDNARHQQQMKEHGILPIDMVVVNLYPFEKTVVRENVTMEEAIENIDIGGPSMIRSAAKNHKYVAVVVGPGRYKSVLEELRTNNGTVSEKTCFELALEAFRHTSSYDRVIADYFGGGGATRTNKFVHATHEPIEQERFPAVLTLELKKKQDLRYGENPHQSAAFYIEDAINEPCVSNAQQLTGKELSYNNIMDLNAALELVKEFEEPTAVIIKHTNPCGAGYAKSLAEAYIKAHSGDPVSAFGCIIGLNRKVDVQTAEEVTAPGHFVEAMIAPDYDKEAIEILTKKRKWGENLRILKTGALDTKAIDNDALDMKRVVGGLLCQGRDLITLDINTIKYVTKKRPTEKEMQNLMFAWIVCKHVKSNAIVLSKEGMVVGVGAGQMSRVDSTEIAIKKAGDKANGSVLASDAFFPFRDSIDIGVKAGITSVIQPGGSNKDDEVIAAANEHNISMVFTGQRHFRH